MPTAKLHIVSFDVPSPPDYGGAIDVYYKIKSLAAAGCDIYLHCFQYGREQAEDLEQYCKEVWYYPRKTGLKGISLVLPYIVYSRRDKTLLQRLKQIEAPILFEGVHSSFYAADLTLKERLKILRTHNVEYDYYSQLYQKEKGIRKLYFMAEAALLYRYERQMNYIQLFASLSQSDNAHFNKLYPGAGHVWVPGFHPYADVSSLNGKGNYCLYHGNLSHPENAEAVLFLLKEVFPAIDMPIIIAGRNPSEQIIQACNKINNCTLIADPGNAEMERLIAEAHIHVLPTFQPTGMKLKLLYALFKGRHVIVNKEMLHGTGLEQTCHIAADRTDFIKKIKELVPIPFTEQEIKTRQSILEQHYNNANNAGKLITYLQ